MSSLLRPCLVFLGLLSVVTGVAYPAAITAAAQTFFPRQANGSLIVSPKGDVLGSVLVGQPFSGRRYFWGRPSATVPGPYNAAASTGSNLGPGNPSLREAIAKRIETLRESGLEGAIPVDLVTSSASGLDPHLTPAAALYQVPRVARARGLVEAEVTRLVLAHVEGRTLGLLGEPRVNILRLNLALDALPSLP